MRNLHWMLALAALLAAVSSPAAGQRAQRPTRIWAAGGVGAAAGNKVLWMPALGQVVLQKAPHQLSARFLITVDPNANLESVWELGLLYGRTLTGAVGHAAISTGLAYTAFRQCGPWPVGGCRRVGVPIVAEAALHPFPILGLGVQAFANLNSRGQYGGLLGFVQLGWMP